MIFVVFYLDRLNYLVVHSIFFTSTLQWTADNHSYEIKKIILSKEETPGHWEGGLCEHNTASVSKVII